MATENLAYKLDDHRFRDKDLYAQAKYDITVDWLRAHIAPGMRLINIGCGSGEFNHQAVRLGLKVVGCEPEKGAFDIARAAMPASNCEILNTGLFDLPATIGLFDLLVMHDVLEHIQNERGAVEAVAALLKTGGRAVISVPALKFLFGHHDTQLGHYRRYTMGTLLPLFAEHFQIRRARYFGFSFIPITLIFSKILKRSYPMQKTSGGILYEVTRRLCRIETRIAPPLGTSILVELEKR